MTNEMRENEGGLPDGAAGDESWIGVSVASGRVFELLRTLQAIDTPMVLITGASGAGKDLVARTVHALGLRRQAPFVEVDCPTIPPHLVESTIFGHEKGAFADATVQHRGVFEVAAGGVVFLSELAELPLATQAKLVRALESRRFRRLGGNQDLTFGAQVIAATNRDLAAEVRAGRFREDLYNRCVIVARHDRAQVHELPTPLHRSGDGPPTATGAAAQHTFVLPHDGCDLDRVERELIEQAMARSGGNQSAAARLVGLDRFALRNRLKRYGMLRPSRRRD